ncbi:MAG: hypothetical protein ACUVS6_11950 [Anaerolineae bacterium]
MLLVLAGPVVASAETLMPGNYCASCHVAADPAPTQLSAWQARPPDEVPCPALKVYREELLYTEQLLTATERAGQWAGSRALAAQEKRLAAFRQGYEALQAAPVTSLDAFTSQAQTLRFQGNKVLTAFNQAIDAGKRARVTLFAALVTLAVLGSLAWGLRNTLKFRPVAQAWWREWRPGWGAGLAIMLVFLLFALPLFRVPAAAVAMPTAEEQAVQNTLDTSGRVADTADRALARAWMLARVGAAWAQLDPAQGQAALEAALAAAADAEAYADALWGQAQAAQEAAIGSLAAQEKAALLAAQLEAVRGRAWGLRLIAAEWAAVDKGRAAEIMAQAQALAERNRTIYGQLDLAAIAAEWARLDPARAATVARQVADPAMRAWAERIVPAAASAANAPYVLRVDRALSPGTDVAAARERLQALTGEADKAEVLRFIAANTGAQADFDAALAMALAARVRGDPLAPAEASLALAQAMLPVDKTMARVAFAQAYEVAQRINVKYK